MTLEKFRTTLPGALLRRLTALLPVLFPLITAKPARAFLSSDVSVFFRLVFP
jgi:hypothetical protein